MDIEYFREIGQLRCKQPQYQAKKQAAINLIQERLLSHKAPYLSLSGGKDSVVMAFLVSEAAIACGKSFRLWSHLSDASFPGTREIVEEVSLRIGRPLDIFESNTALENAASKQRQAFGKSGVFYDSIRDYAADKDLAFVGVRAWESKRRMKAAKIKGNYFHSKSMGDVDVCYPLMWYKLEDIAAATYEYGAPLHPIYGKLALDGKNKFGEEQWIRLGYITSKDLLNKGTAVFLKINYPSIFNKLAAEFPAIRQYT